MYQQSQDKEQHSSLLPFLWSLSFLSTAPWETMLPFTLHYCIRHFKNFSFGRENSGSITIFCFIISEIYLKTTDPSAGLSIDCVCSIACSTWGFSEWLNNALLVVFVVVFFFAHCMLSSQVNLGRLNTFIEKHSVTERYIISKRSSKQSPF